MADLSLISFEQFYRKFQPALVSFATYILHVEDDAIEVVNDVFMKVWEKRESLKLDESLKSYLYTSTKNACLNHLKKNKKTWMHLDTDELDIAGEDETKKMEARESLDRMRMLLDQLPPKCRQVFMMRRVDGLPNKEIATLLEISVKTVENQMTKALKYFKKNLNRE